MTVVLRLGLGTGTLEQQARELIERCGVGPLARELRSGEVIELANVFAELVMLRRGAGFCECCGDAEQRGHLTGCERANRLPPPPSLAVPDAALAAKGFQSTGGDERTNQSHVALTRVKPMRVGAREVGRVQCQLCRTESVAVYAAPVEGGRQHVAADIDWETAVLIRHSVGRPMELRGGVTLGLLDVELEVLCPLSGSALRRVW